MYFLSITENPDAPAKSVSMFAEGESTEFAGMAVAHLASDPNVMSKTGRILFTADLAREYGFKDTDGRIPDILTIKNVLLSNGNTWLAALTPGFLRVPHVLLHYASYKF